MSFTTSVYIRSLLNSATIFFSLHKCGLCPKLPQHVLVGLTKLRYNTLDLWRDKVSTTFTSYANTQKTTHCCLKTRETATETSESQKLVINASPGRNRRKNVNSETWRGCAFEAILEASCLTTSLGCRSKLSSLRFLALNVVRNIPFRSNTFEEDPAKLATSLCMSNVSKKFDCFEKTS